MSRKARKKPPESHIQPRTNSRPAVGPDPCPTNMGLSPSSHNHYAAAAICVLLLVAVALVFGQTVRHEFINCDDNEYVYDNPQIQGGLTAEGIVTAFTQFQASNWHPLTWLSHMLDCQLYGLAHPGGHHLTNVLLHAASTLILFLVLRRMTGDLWPSALVAALFAIHPLHVESVAWVAERKDVLSGLFFMLILAAYVGYVGRPFSLLRYLLVTGLFVLGLMAKPMLVTVPFVLLLLDYWPLRRLGAEGDKSVVVRGESGRRLPAKQRKIGDWSRLLPLVIEKLPWFMLAGVSCIVTYLAQGDAVAPYQALPLSPRMANAAVSYVAYLGQFFYPTKLTILYPYERDALPTWTIIGSLLLLVGISWAALACRRKCPYLPVGWLWYVGMLVPVIGLVQVGQQAMADRYTYLPQIGLYLALGWGAAHVLRRWPRYRWAGGVALALVVVAFGWCAWQQTAHWKNNETLWAQALSCTSKNWLAHCNVGTALATRGQIDEAAVHYREAIAINPDHVKAHYCLATVLGQRGQIGEALVHYKRAIELEPNHARAMNNMAMIFATCPEDKYRDGKQAVRLASRAAELRPNDPIPRNTLAAAYAETGQFSRAVQTAREALTIAKQQNAEGLIQSIEAQLRLYEAGKPFRDRSVPVR